MSEWRSVVGWEAIYEVSDAGEVRGCVRTLSKRDGTTQRIRARSLCQTKQSAGYLLVRLSDTTSGRRVQARTHRLVADAFIPNPTGRPEVNHIDGAKTNNAANNLEWVTSRENRLHAWRIGLRTRAHLPIRLGADNGAAKLTDALVLTIRQEKAGGASIGGLARRHGVNKRTMQALLRGKTWRHLLPDPPVDPARQEPGR